MEQRKERKQSKIFNVRKVYYLKYQRLLTRNYLIRENLNFFCLLAYRTYILARKPEMWTKLLKEIDEISEEEELDYDRVDHSNCLDLFVREVLRMFPVSIQVILRECTQDTVVCGYTIRKGQCIVLRLLKPNKFITQCTSFGKYTWCYSSGRLFFT